jgi:Uma2 family endonuclease
MVQTPIRPITLDHFLSIPETKPASEYIDGQIIQKPMPQGHHSIIQCKLSTELDILLEREGIATVFTELRCTFGDRSCPISLYLRIHEYPSMKKRISTTILQLLPTGQLRFYPQVKELLKSSKTLPTA